jgi:glutaredoxin
MDLKAQIKGELIKQKEEKLQKEKELNASLKEITLYTRKDNPICENYKKFYTENGIKFKEKDLAIHNEVTAIVQNNAVPVIFINDNYLVQGRDFTNPQQSIGAIRHFANPDYVAPPFNQLLLQSIKNLQFGLNKSIGGLQRQIQPIVKIMNELSQEENAKENK